MFKHKYRVFAVIALTLLATSAGGERTATAQEGAAAAGRHTVLRVQSSLNVFMPGLGSLEEQRAAGETGRRAIYDMANRECRLLVEVFRGECKLTAVNANVNVQARSSGNEGISVSGTATYELTLRSN